MLPFILEEAGHDNWSIATAMSIVSFSDLIMRMLLTVTLDYQCVSPLFLYRIGQTIILIVPLGEKRTFCTLGMF